MKNFASMKRSQATDDLNEYIPNLFFFDVCLSLLVATDLLEYVSVVSILHDETET